MTRALHANDHSAVISYLVSGNQDWLRRVQTAPSLHLAIVLEPFLSYLLDGVKTIESRFSQTRAAPFEQVSAGDVLLLKRSGGPIIGLALVGSTDFVYLSSKTWPRVRALSNAICADDAFWLAQSQKKYATLMHVVEVCVTPPLNIVKRDRRPWVVLSRRSQPGLPLVCA